MQGMAKRDASYNDCRVTQGEVRNERETNKIFRFVLSGEEKRRVECHDHAHLHSDGQDDDKRGHASSLPFSAKHMADGHRGMIWRHECPLDSVR